MREQLFPVSGWLRFPVVARFKIQATTNGATTDGITAVETSQITFLNFSREINYSKSSTFGDAYDAVSALDDLVITSSTWSEKCRLVYSYLPAGIYRINTSVSISTTTTTNVSLQLLDIYASSGTMYTVYNRTSTHPAGTFYYQTTEFLTAAEGAHVLLLQVSSPNAVTFTCKQTILDCWRVY